MIEILAEMAEMAQTAQTATAPTAMQTYGPIGALLLAMGGWKGIAQAILWFQGRQANGNGSAHKYVPQTECNLRHEMDNQMSAALVKSIDKLEEAVTRLHDRIDTIGGDQRSD